MASADKIAQWRANRNGAWGSHGGDNRKMSSWNVALEEYNRHNLGTGNNGGAFAIPSRRSADYDRVRELAEKVREEGRPVKWEEMGFPNLRTTIDRPIHPCSLGSLSTGTISSANSSQSSRYLPTPGKAPYSRPSPRSTSSTESRYSDASVGSRPRTGSTVYQSAVSQAPSSTRRTLDFREADNFFDYGLASGSSASTSGGYNPQSGRFELPDSP